ncbi:unnamed protein product [Sphenostylis stenocarpa]|uniref:Uncharacterized protein n=1 Tax=Sphenostylis stenocarpa TaxID=92480 RepID=A0AA86V2I4_9FABA|nr:unnamed protein product [Sphenostylis stenocarpa]
MEKQGHECTIINIPDIQTAPLQNDQPKPLKVKKMSGAMRFLRVALFVMRGSSAKSKAIYHDQIHDGSKSTWKNLMGSMRPLQLQSDQSPRCVSDSAAIFWSPATDCCGYVSEFAAQEGPYSPSPPSSRYGSAVGLNELVQSSDGDETIDTKAEDFISQFYEEMRLQRMNTVDRGYLERSQRSLGW